MERNRFTFKDIRAKVATVAALTLALSVACSPAQESNQNQAQARTATPSAAGSTMLPPEVTGKDFSVVIPAACPGAFGTERKVVGALGTMFPADQMKDLEGNYQGAKTSEIQGFYGEYVSADSRPIWLVSKDGQEVPLGEGQANLCVSRSHLANLEVASSEIVKPADENIQWKGFISMNDGELTSVPYNIGVTTRYYFVGDERPLGRQTTISAMFEVFDPKLESNRSSEDKPGKINNLRLHMQQVDTRTSLPIPDTQRIFNVSFAGQ